MFYPSFILNEEWYTQQWGDGATNPLETLCVYGRNPRYTLEEISETPWEVGSEHLLELTIANVSCQYHVRLIEDPVDYIEAEDIVLHEGENFYWYPGLPYDEIRKEEMGPIPFYPFFNSLKLTIHYKDGTVKTFSDFTYKHNWVYEQPEIVRETGFQVSLTPDTLGIRPGETRKATLSL